MTKRFKKSHMLSPSLSPNEELSAMKSSGYRRDSFDRFGSDLSAVIFSYFNTAEQLIFRELNRSASNHMFDHSLIMVLSSKIGDINLSSLDKLAKYYRRTVRKAWIDLDIYCIDDVCYLLTALLKGRKSLDVLYLSSQYAWCSTNQICHLINSIDPNFAKELYLNFTMCLMRDTTFGLLSSKLGSSLAGVGIQMTYFDFFNVYKSSLKIKKLKVWLDYPYFIELKEISERFPYLERLYIFSNEVFDSMELLIPLSQSYFPNINYFAFHHTNGKYDTLNKMCVIGHRMMYYLSRKEFPSNPVMDLKDHSHLVFSKSQKSLWLVANTYLGYPKIPSSVKNVFFIFSEWKSLLAEELQAMNILEVNPSINYFRSRFISESVRLENKRKDLELERDANYLF